MREWLQSGFIRLFGVCAMALLCELIAENTKKSACYTALKTVCALCVCVTVFSSFSSDLSTERLKQAFENAEQSLTSIVPTGTEPEAAVLERTRDELITQTKQRILEKYGITPVELGISFSVTKQDGQTLVGVETVQIRWEEGVATGAALSAEEELRTLFGEVQTLS